MRGDDNQQQGMFSYISTEKPVPTEHSLRPIRKMVDEILKEMSPQFAKLYSDVGRRRLTTKFMVMLAHSLRATRSEILGPDG
jgi:hypothetical protein